ncbi:hypothetical protein IF1G_00711 [Cordyceps javanica]|uniref:Uncharacterized protein n=1 Tax=Cordyceps javanica TaxID=43265 RepID=A0A545VGM1_9HYPO|nr:hypothetical protein IF1G_00711 [Cordyceps javanica]
MMVRTKVERMKHRSYASGQGKWSQGSSNVHMRAALKFTASSKSSRRSAYRGTFLRVHSSLTHLSCIRLYEPGEVGANPKKKGGQG